jgi:hypothetical protein
MQFKAIVKCSDGKCYPCFYYGITVDGISVYPLEAIEFIDKSPENAPKKILVNAEDISNIEIIPGKGIVHELLRSASKEGKRIG